MEKVIIASMRKSAGKTSAIVGITAATKKKIAMSNPSGRDALPEEAAVDYDSSLISALFGLKEDPVDEHRVRPLQTSLHVRRGGDPQESDGDHRQCGRRSDILFIEGGRDLSYGISVHLTPSPWRNIPEDGSSSWSAGTMTRSWMISSSSRGT